MTTRRANPNLVKIHRNYTVEEIATLFHVHKNTVRAWLKAELPVVDGHRPKLILGRELKAFLQAKRSKNKCRCELDELYCLHCRKPQKAAEKMADFHAVTDKVGNLTAICPCCESWMNKRVSLAKLPEISAHIDITFAQALKHIGGSNQPSLNSDLK